MLQRGRNSGATLWGGMLALVVVVILIGTGLYIVHHQPGPTNTAATDSSAGSNSDGTSASIDQLTQNDAATEQSVDQKADTQMQQDALSTNSAAGNVGGAYNESNL